MPRDNNIVYISWVREYNTKRAGADVRVWEVRDNYGKTCYIYATNVHYDARSGHYAYRKDLKGNIA